MIRGVNCCGLLMTSARPTYSSGEDSEFDDDSPLEETPLIIDSDSSSESESDTNSAVTTVSVGLSSNSVVSTEDESTDEPPDEDFDFPRSPLIASAGKIPTLSFATVTIPGRHLRNSSNSTRGYTPILTPKTRENAVFPLFEELTKGVPSTKHTPSPRLETVRIPLAGKTVFETPKAVNRSPARKTSAGGVDYESLVESLCALDVLKCVSFALERIVFLSSLDRVHTHYETFDERLYPFCSPQWSISVVPQAEHIHNYLGPLLKYCGWQELVCTLAYMERLVQWKDFALYPVTWRRALLGCFLLSRKFLAERNWRNADLLDALPHANMTDLTDLERNVINLLDFNIFISDTEFAKYVVCLQKFAHRKIAKTETPRRSRPHASSIDSSGFKTHIHPRSQK